MCRLHAPYLLFTIVSSELVEAERSTPKNIGGSQSTALMAFPSTLTSSSSFTTNSLFYTSPRASSPSGLSTSSPSVIAFSPSFKAFCRKPNAIHQQIRKYNSSVKALSLDFSGSFFEGGLGGEDSPPGPPISVADDKDEPQCPPGLRQYETMAVLRPDLTEDERLVVTQKYEEVLIQFK